MHQEPVVKDNKNLRDSLREKLSTLHFLPNDKSLRKEAVKLIEDFFLPTLIYYFYKNGNDNFPRYLSELDFNQSQYKTLIDRARAFTSQIDILVKYSKTSKIAPLGDMHPGGSTKYLSGKNVYYRDFPDYDSAMRDILRRIISDYDKFLPRIEKSREGEIKREFIDIKKDSSSESEVREYYFNLGRFIPSLLLLRAIDVNAENMLVRLPYPKFFDLETIFSPDLEENFDEYGIRNTGIVNLEESNDSSVLTGGILKNESLLKPILKGGIKDPSIIWRTTSKTSYDNIPSLNNTQVNPLNYINEIQKGYSEVVIKILKSRKDLLNTDFDKSFVRLILRPTRMYRLIILKSCYPQIYLNEGIENFIRSELEEAGLIYKINSSNLFREELSAIRKLLVPVFYIEINSKEVISSEGVIVGTVNRFPVEVWKEYVRDILSEEYFRDQMEIILNSLK